MLVALLMLLFLERLLFFRLIRLASAFSPLAAAAIVASSAAVTARIVSRRPMRRGDQASP